MLQGLRRIELQETDSPVPSALNVNKKLHQVKQLGGHIVENCIITQSNSFGRDCSLQCSTLTLKPTDGHRTTYFCALPLVT